MIDTESIPGDGEFVPCWMMHEKAGRTLRSTRLFPTSVDDQFGVVGDVEVDPVPVLVPVEGTVDIVEPGVVVGAVVPAPELVAPSVVIVPSLDVVPVLVVPEPIVSVPLVPPIVSVPVVPPVVPVPDVVPLVELPVAPLVVELELLPDLFFFIFL